MMEIEKEERGRNGREARFMYSFANAMSTFVHLSESI